MGADAGGADPAGVDPAGADPAGAAAAEGSEAPVGRARLRLVTGGRAASSEPNREQTFRFAAGPAAERSPIAEGDSPGAEGAEAVETTEPVEAAEAAEAVDGGAQTPAAADFRVRCPDCGPQYVAIADVRFISTGGDADTDRYLFTCPACGLRVRRPAGPELARILRSAGVATLALRRGPDQAL